MVNARYKKKRIGIRGEEHLWHQSVLDPTTHLKYGDKQQKQTPVKYVNLIPNFTSCYSYAPIGFATTNEC